MTTTSNQSGLYILRVIANGVALIALPAAPFAFISLVPQHFRWLLLLWIPVGLYLWTRLSRWLLVDSRYECPKCSKKTARIEVVEDKDVGRVFLACPACGFREESDDVAWHARSG